MKLDVEELDGLRRKLKITIPEEVVTQRINNAYRELNKQIRMPGFRPGKIPQGLLEKQVPVESFTQMFQELMQDYYNQALKKTGFEPAGAPEIDHSELKEIKKNAPLNFSVILDVKPSIQLIDYKGLHFKKHEASVTEDEVEAAVHKVLQRHGHFEIYGEDHQAQKGDFVKMDFEGFFEGEPLEGGTARDFACQIGEKKMIEGFEDQLVGHKVGEEFEVKAVLPPNWNNKIRRVSIPVPGADPEKREDLATFKVKIKEMVKLNLPELNDDIAQKEGRDTVEEFRRKVKIDLQAAKEQQEEFRIKDILFNKLVKEHDVNPPESLVKKELDFMIEGMKFQIEQSGMKLEDSGFEIEKAEEEFRERAEFNSKGYMILEAIAARENIHVTDADLEEEYKKLAETSKQKPEDVKRKLMANPESMRQTTSKLLGQKTLNFIYSSCEFEYVKDAEPQKSPPANP